MVVVSAPMHGGGDAGAGAGGEAGGEGGGGAGGGKGGEGGEGGRKLWTFSVTWRHVEIGAGPNRSSCTFTSFVPTLSGPNFQYDQEEGSQ